MADKEEKLSELLDTLIQMCDNLNRRITEHNDMFEVVAKQINVLDKITETIETKVEKLENKIYMIDIHKDDVYYKVSD